jgi:hypothetical protein
MMNDYQKIENTLCSLLGVLADTFTESECNEVKEFIDAGEYGIALETLIDIIEEESKSIPKEALLLIKIAGECMDMDSNTIEKRVSFSGLPKP